MAANEEEASEVLRELEAILRANGHQEILDGVREKLAGKTEEEHELLEWSASQQLQMLLDAIEAAVILVEQLDDSIVHDQVQIAETDQVQTIWRVAGPTGSPIALADPAKRSSRRSEADKLMQAIAGLRSEFG